MLTETISGKCPCCGYDKMIQRYGSMGYFQMDSCPNCGFGYGTNLRDEGCFGSEVWIEYFKYLLECWDIDFDESESDESIRKKVFDKIEVDGSRFCDVETTVFSYNKEDIDNHKKLGLKIFNKQRFV